MLHLTLQIAIDELEQQHFFVLAFVRFRHRDDEVLRFPTLYVVFLAHEIDLQHRFVDVRKVDRLWY
jgi:hypothetical protein